MQKVVSWLLSHDVRLRGHLIFLVGPFACELQAVAACPVVRCHGIVVYGAGVLLGYSSLVYFFCVHTASRTHYVRAPAPTMPELERQFSARTRLGVKNTSQFQASATRCPAMVVAPLAWSVDELEIMCESTCKMHNG